jgi:hypothetical protein
MLGIPGFADGPRGQRIFNLRRLDAAMDARLTFTGGGNRQRRRIYGAVGPERANYARRARTYSDVSWAKEGTGTGSAPVIVSESVADPDGGTTATRVTFDLGGGTTLSDASRLTQYEPTGTTVGAAYTQGLWAKIPLGESILVRNVGASDYSDLAGTGGWKRYSRTEISAAGQRVFEIGLRGGLPGAIGSDAVTVDLWWATLEDGTELTPVVPNDTTGTVTTTDWPRTNKASVSEGTTANLDAQLYFTNAATSIVGFDNSLNVPAGSALAGTGYAYKSCSFPDGTLVGVSLFVEMDDGGAPVPSTSGGPSYDFMLVADGFGIAAADCVVEHVAGRLYRVSGSKVASIAGGGNAFYGVVKYAAQSERGCRVTGWHVRDMAAGFDAYIKTGSGGRTVVTPPFGQLVTVPAGQPRIDYDTNGIGRGFKAFGAAANNIAYSGVNPGQYYYYATEDCAASLQTMWDPLVGYFIRVTKTAGGAGPTYRAGVRQDVTGMLGPASSVGVKVRFNGAGAKGYAPYMDINDAGGGVHANAVDYSAPPLGEWIDSSRSVNASVMVGTGSFYIWNEGPVGTSIDFAMPQCNAGNHLHEYIPTDGSAEASDAESLETFDLAALDLHNGRGTILVDFIMPEVTSGNSHGVMSCANANGFEWMGVYTSTTDVAVSCYSGGTRYEFARGGFSAGDRVRAALTFDTGYFASAVNGVPGPVTYGNNPIAFDRVIVGDLVGPRSYPADTTISRVVTTGRVMFLDELVGKTAL